MKFVFPLPAHAPPQGHHAVLGAGRTGADQTRMVNAPTARATTSSPSPSISSSAQHVESSGRTICIDRAQAHIGGATEHIAINSCVTILPLQHPIVLAKALATADWMSGGRMMVTFGVGWLAREFELSGSLSRAGPHRRRILSGDRRIVDQRHTAIRRPLRVFDNIAFEPKPVQKPPSDLDRRRRHAALRRAAKDAIRVVAVSDASRADRRKTGLHQVPALL